MCMYCTMDDGIDSTSVSRAPEWNFTRLNRNQWAIILLQRVPTIVRSKYLWTRPNDDTINITARIGRYLTVRAS